MRTTNSKSAGFALIEAMISLVILAIGLLAIGKFQAELMATSGHNKARAEAIAIAESAMEDIRNRAISAFDEIDAEGSTNVAKLLTTYTLKTAAPLQCDGQCRQVTVTVSWTDWTTGSDQQIELVSLVSNLDPLALHLERFDEDLAGKIRLPFGEDTIMGGVDPVTGRPVSKSYTEETLPENAKKDETTGWYTLETEDGTTELIDSNYNVVMTILNGQEFSSVAGKVFIEQDATGGIFIKPNNFTGTDSVYVQQKLFLIPSAQCVRIVSTPLAVDTASNLKFFSYKCYFGPGWAGNIGIEKIDGASNNTRVCLGDEEVGFDPEKDATRHPSARVSRMYRGFREFQGLQFSSNWGIGMEVEEGQDVGTTNPDDLKRKYVARNYEDHHFLLTQLRLNNVTAAQESDACRGKMDFAVFRSGQSENNPLGGQGSAPYAKVQPGRFFCLSESCPAKLPLGDPPITFIDVEIAEVGSAAVSGVSLVETGETAGSSACVDTTASGANQPFKFQCSIDWRGSIGDKWEGHLFVSTGTGTTLCNNLIATPTGAAALDTTNNRIAFAKPLTTESVSQGIQLQLSATSSSCP
ncbi:type IV pilus modification PilV family protein [Rhodocyclaceae bacterium SMB388]